MKSQAVNPSKEASSTQEKMDNTLEKKQEKMDNTLEKKQEKMDNTLEKKQEKMDNTLEKKQEKMATSDSSDKSKENSRKSWNGDQQKYMKKVSKMSRVDAQKAFIPSNIHGYIQNEARRVANVKKLVRENGGGKDGRAAVKEKYPGINTSERIRSPYDGQYDVGHKIVHVHGGGNDPENLAFELRTDNRSRGHKEMKAANAISERKDLYNKQETTSEGHSLPTNNQLSPDQAIDQTKETSHMDETLSQKEQSESMDMQQEQSQQQANVEDKLVEQQANVEDKLVEQQAQREAEQAQSMGY